MVDATRLNEVETIGDLSRRYWSNSREDSAESVICNSSLRNAVLYMIAFGKLIVGRRSR